MVSRIEVIIEGIFKLIIDELSRSIKLIDVILFGLVVFFYRLLRSAKRRGAILNRLSAR